MNWLQTIRMAFKSIANNKVRSFLTMLGIIIGVASVITLVASIQGLATLSRLQLEAMGSNQIHISGWELKSDDWEMLEKTFDKELKERIKGWSPQSRYYDWQSKGVQYRGKVLSDEKYHTNIYFGNEDYSMVTNNTISSGRDISPMDIKYASRVCIIGDALRRYFFGAMSPIGQKIYIGGKSFEIIGTYKARFGGRLNSDDQMILLPYTLQPIMMDVRSAGDRNYYVQTNTKEDIQPTVDFINQLMKPRVGENGYFDCSSNAQYQEQMERTREIGIRMAIGARRRDIIGQFLIESAAVSCFGGLIGIALGCFGSAIIGNLMIGQIIQSNSGWMPDVEQFTVLPSVPLVLGAFLFSALLGIIFGLYPANKAAKLQPVDALRTQ